MTVQNNSIRIRAPYRRQQLLTGEGEEPGVLKGEL
jgi:hypothetical protein